MGNMRTSEWFYPLGVLLQADPPISKCPKLRELRRFGAWIFFLGLVGVCGGFLGFFKGVLLFFFSRVV